MLFEIREKGNGILEAIACRNYVFITEDRIT